MSTSLAQTLVPDAVEHLLPHLLVEWFQRDFFLGLLLVFALELLLQTRVGGDHHSGLNGQIFSVRPSHVVERAESAVPHHRRFREGLSAAGSPDSGSDSTCTTLNARPALGVVLF